MNIQTPMTTTAVEALHVVPAVDAVTNAYMRDVVGNKEDPLYTLSGGTTQSLVARVKGCLGLLQADAVDNISASYARSGIGNKGDTPVTAVGTTKSIMAYLKGLISKLPFSGTVGGTVTENLTNGTASVAELASSATANTFGAWVAIDAVAAADEWICGATVYPGSLDASSVLFCLQIGVGAGGSEVARFQCSARYLHVTNTIALNPIVYSIPIPIFVASGARVSCRISDNQAVALDYTVSVQFYQGL